MFKQLIFYIIFPFYKEYLKLCNQKNIFLMPHSIAQSIKWCLMGVFHITSSKTFFDVLT